MDGGVGGSSVRASSERPTFFFRTSLCFPDRLLDELLLGRLWEDFCVRVCLSNRERFGALGVGVGVEDRDLCLRLCVLDRPDQL